MRSKVATGSTGILARLGGLGVQTVHALLNAKCQLNTSFHVISMGKPKT